MAVRGARRAPERSESPPLPRAGAFRDGVQGRSPWSRAKPAHNREVMFIWLWEMCAEAEDAVIVRLLETVGKATTAKVFIDSKIMCEVTKVIAVDLNERELKDSTVGKIKDGFSVNMPPHGISSVKVWLD